MFLLSQEIYLPCTLLAISFTPWYSLSQGFLFRALYLLSVWCHNCKDTFTIQGQKTICAFASFNLVKKSSRNENLMILHFCILSKISTMTYQIGGHGKILKCVCECVCLCECVCVCVREKERGRAKFFEENHSLVKISMKIPSH